MENQEEPASGNYERNRSRDDRRRMSRRTLLTLGGLGVVGLVTLGAGVVGLRYVTASNGKTGLETLADLVLKEKDQESAETRLQRAKDRLYKTENLVEICTYEDLLKIGKDPNFPLNGDYALVSDIDCKGKPNFEPIGDGSNPFSGTFNGNNHAISNLYINKPDSNNVGLFSNIRSRYTLIIDLQLINVNVIGNDNVGSIVGLNYFGGIIRCNIEGKIRGGRRNIGGISGFNSEGNILSSHTNLIIKSNGENIGGLVGWNSGGFFKDSVVEGKIQGGDYIGGLVGFNYIGNSTNSVSHAILDAKGKNLSSESGYDVKK